MDERAGDRVVMTSIITNEKPAEATILDGLFLVFSTTHPFGKEQANVLYHDDDAQV